MWSSTREMAFNFAQADLGDPFETATSRFQNQLITITLIDLQ